MDVVADLPVGADGGGTQGLTDLCHRGQQLILHWRDTGAVHGGAQLLQTGDGGVQLGLHVLVGGQVSGRLQRGDHLVDAGVDLLVRGVIRGTHVHRAQHVLQIGQGIVGGVQHPQQIGGGVIRRVKAGADKADGAVHGLGGVPQGTACVGDGDGRGGQQAVSPVHHILQ